MLSGGSAGVQDSGPVVTSPGNSQRGSERSSRRTTSPLAGPSSTLASIPDFDSSSSSRLYTIGSDMSYVTNSRGASRQRLVLTAA